MRRLNISLGKITSDRRKKSSDRRETLLTNSKSKPKYKIEPNYLALGKTLKKSDFTQNKQKIKELTCKIKLSLHFEVLHKNEPHTEKKN